MIKFSQQTDKEQLELPLVVKEAQKTELPSCSISLTSTQMRELSVGCRRTVIQISSWTATLLIAGFGAGLVVSNAGNIMNREVHVVHDQKSHTDLSFPMKNTSSRKPHSKSKK